jgi:isopenicillin-N epimerase
MTSSVQGVPVAWEARSELFTLDRRFTHLNHGSFGAVPLPVQRAQQRLRDEMDANPMAFFTRGLLDRLAHTRARLAGFVGADAGGVALVPNATAAANAVLRSVVLAAGQEILLTDHGYGAVRLAAEEVAGRVGATVRAVMVPLTSDDDEAVARVVEAVRPGRTRLVVVDHVASPTARLFPVNRLVAELQQRGVLVLVDAAHAPGMLDLDVAAIGADFWLGNLHKWAFAPRPTALLAVAPEHRAGMRPLVVSWEQPYGYPRSQEFAGTLDYTTWLAAPTGLHLLRTLDPERVRSHNNDLVMHGQRAVAAAVSTRWPPRDSTDQGRAAWLEQARAGRLGSDLVSMRPVPLPPGVADEASGAAALQARLATEYDIEAALTAWNGLGLIRLSAQIYNQIDDYHRLAQALREVLPTP